MNQKDFSKLATEKVFSLTKEVSHLPWEDVGFFNSWLTQTHEFVTYTPVFLKMCYEKTPEGHPLKKQFAMQIREEDGHEKLTGNDMKFMKASGEVFAATRAFWKTQFYWIEKKGAAAHLGYSLLLEGLAAKAGPAIVERVKKAGHKGYTFLKVHAEEDQDHFEKALASIEDLTDLERKNIYDNLCEAYEMYLVVLHGCETQVAKAA